MPIVGVGRDALFALLGKKYEQEEFEELCFEFGIELDDVVEEEVKTTKTRAGAAEAHTEVVYKVEVPANRYDILCLEGLARALNVFNGKAPPPAYTLRDFPGGAPLTMSVDAETAAIRPFVVCAVLRDCTFDDRSYNSFLDLQDKMHHNICRRRTLVAIGTHDLDTLTPPFRYRALPPKDINFVPLAQERSFNAEELFQYYDDPKNNSPLKKFLPIIQKSPVYPVIYDAKDRVLSLPPIINGNHSRISAATKNVLIECTCTDLTKGKIVLNTIVAMFSQYSSTPFSVEPVDVVYPSGPSHAKLAGTTLTTPDLAKGSLTAKVGYIQRAIGLSPEQLGVWLSRELGEDAAEIVARCEAEMLSLKKGATHRRLRRLWRGGRLILHDCSLRDLAERGARVRPVRTFTRELSVLVRRAPKLEPSRDERAAIREYIAAHSGLDLGPLTHNSRYEYHDDHCVSPARCPADHGVMAI